MLFHNMDNLEKLLNKELLHEKDSKCALSVIKVKCDKFLHSKVLKPSNYDGHQIREIFKEYTRMEAQSYKDLIIQYIESIENCIVERELNEQEIQKKLKRSGNECSKRSDFGNDTNVKPSYDTEPIAENDSNVTSDSSDMSHNVRKIDQYTAKYEKKYLKEDMYEDLKYVKSLEKEVDEFETQKDEFSNEYDLLPQECLSNDIMCAILRSFDDIDEQIEMQCLCLEKCQECENLELELSKSKTQQIDKRFVNLEQHYIELELTLQHKKEKNVFENS
ncbi:hypothetical protein Tco_0312197 [Tanacetum coccineum]